MKVMIGIVKSLERSRSQRKKALLLKHKHKLKSLSRNCNLLSLETLSVRDCGSIDKIRIKSTASISLENIPIPSSLPPAYDECIRVQPPTMTGCSRVSDYAEEKIPPTTAPEVCNEITRGRTSQVVYRSQLSGLAKRKSIRRPSPPRNGTKLPLEFGTVDGPVALRVQCCVQSWWKSLAIVQMIGLLVVLMSCFLLVLGY
ncbi:hypothetical protein METBIDRAFT_200378 [Metschnikowia bicuspidata var. bicuspidata NRRL YB-4993]|uniref:Uncharacterized protein n=1 Tax=Metschnikowia bicuspidata var. bicuspidata NRRL YB-4993 TaxID=869754 RepID=A0A1A0H8S7_9ASCO|nr:hypothetical protein METBIDRAFT_200378 [Metschnikowia bicuspidata var. bicuspidata NRRL YB-4993]OBA20524.1 hypothetical protein METBIDRAFT_200378 [Metschnikowia bicuspidata var. bicuspidata NRRL YB-4993]